MSVTATSLRTQFFDFLFGDTSGYVCIATSSVDKTDFKQTFFAWPEQRNDLGSFVDAASHRKNVWYCTSLLERRERKKEFCLPGTLVWADLDTCHPDTVEPSPTAVVLSSPSRYQALWQLDEVVEPYLQEDYSKRIAYKYSVNGADPSGWDLTQLLRVPLTFNYKYAHGAAEIPRVELLSVSESKLPKALFEQIARPERKSGELGPSDVIDTMPSVDDLPDAESIIYKYFAQLNNNLPFKSIYQTIPGEDEDWSKVLWRLLNICLEANMSEEETFVIALTSKCNKYARDNRPLVHLWEDVVRASIGQRKVSSITASMQALLMPELVTDAEIASTPKSFINEYYDWGTEATDAVPEFHNLSAFILLSSVIAAGVTLKTDYGPMVPNLWGLILGDSTLSRKTTAMRMAMDMLTDIDQELILATDGSTEGLLTGLGTRPNRASLYFKDEVSGFFDSINRKDYLAGMPETFAQLYDVPRVLSRRLRKETITIQSPVFIFFGGGIRDKVYSLVSDEYILSGFLPRFLVVSGEADLARIRRTGPAREVLGHKRQALEQKVANLYELYNSNAVITIGGQEIETTVRNEAKLTPEAWQRYGDIEEKMVNAAYESSVSMLALPTFERLSRSLLKMSILLACSRQSPQEGVVEVNEADVIESAGYVQRWGRYSVELVLGAGTGQSERQLNKILSAIESNPGVTRSYIMTRHHLGKREMDEILGTLIDRGQVITTKAGRGVTLKAV